MSALVAFERLQELQALQEEITAKRLRAWLGQRVEVLLDGPSQSDPGCLRGRTSQNTVVNLTSQSDELEPGMLIEAQITEVARHTLKGVLTP